MDPQDMKGKVEIKHIIYNKILLISESKYICAQHQYQNIKYTYTQITGTKAEDLSTKIRDFQSTFK